MARKIDLMTLQMALNLIIKIESVTVPDEIDFNILRLTFVHN